MTRIKILPHDLTLKIAAGEVIEKPASIVKELLENSLDAGATNISITLENGGLESISVIDNGEGMTRQEAILAFERFATSKISRVDDLFNINTYGFRGEALPSIAAIARVEMTTRPRNMPLGVRVMVENGKIIDVWDVDAPFGTRISVDKIFENVPARRKFQKSAATEQSYCLDRITKIALAVPNVRIEVKGKGKTILTIPTAYNLADRVFFVLGPEISKKLLEIQGEKKGIHLKGFIGHPSLSRNSTRFIHFFVNRRPVRDNILLQALMNSYRGYLTTGRYPVAILHVNISPQEVDVNVHPAKAEVRFRDPSTVYSLILELVSQALSSSTFSLKGNVYPLQKEKYTTHSKIDVDSVCEPKTSYLNTENFLSFQSLELLPNPDTPTDMDVFTLFSSDVQYLGSLQNTYLVFTTHRGIILVDQHAAHERIIFDKLNKKLTSSPGMVQHLLIPETITLPPHCMEKITRILPTFEKIGLSVEIFGENTLIVRSVPSETPNLNIEHAIFDILAECENGLETENRLEKIKLDITRILACRGAIKAGEPMSPEEACNLWEELSHARTPLTCPHGRPTLIHLSLRNIEASFLRR
ncbi:MAG: DNA mismatch repair endonuclease MutL [Syntrophales bacterium]|nr:DNA mismatch repair endonuclease MutL [Syntrophales bacterium]